MSHLDTGPADGGHHLLTEDDRLLALSHALRDFLEAT